jgi:hypothetical protein
MSNLGSFFRTIRGWFRRRIYREGRTLSRFIACDIRRDVQVISAARIDGGTITGRVRTINVLYVYHGVIQEPEFGPAEELSINELWDWTGQSWGGLPNGTSIFDRNESASTLNDKN